MKIDEVNLKIIKDSRGENTLQATIKVGNFYFSADVPSGESRGSHEAFVLDPVLALQKFETIKSRVVERECNDQALFDTFLRELDGTPNKNNLGGNTILAFSIAWARAKAKLEGLELYEYIGKMFDVRYEPRAARMPHPIFNMIEGGAHVRHEKNKLDFQEFQVIPYDTELRRTDTELRGQFNFTKAFDAGREFYAKLGVTLEETYGKENVTLGDESGFSAPFQKNEEALDILDALIKNMNGAFKIGLDIAANQLLDADGIYTIGQKKYSASGLIPYYFNLVHAYPIISLEDPLGEESFDDFASLRTYFYKLLGTKEFPLVITDDLTTTNQTRLGTAIERDAGNAIIIKPNQIGTVTETIEVARLAERAGWKKIVSHRSRDTTDDFISDLAVGVRAWGIKAGAPEKPERLAKYKRLIKIAGELSS